MKNISIIRKIKKHVTGNVRIKSNAYGNRKVSTLTSRGKTKKHTITAQSVSFGGRKGSAGKKSEGYIKPRYVGRKTGRKA